MIPASVFFVFIISAATDTAYSQSGYKMTPIVSIEDGQNLSSAQGIFELGFFSPSGSSNWYLGIWFKKIPQTVVWVANRESPLNSSTGVLNLTADGNLAIFNGTGYNIWSTGTSNATNPTLQLLDSGNLVLKDEATNSTLWQSFDQTTRTFLPRQKIGFDFRTNHSLDLTSWKNEIDPSPGEYSYSLKMEGVPEFYLSKGNTHIYRNGPWTGKGFSGRPNMASTNIFKFYFVRNQNEVYYAYEVIDSSVLAVVTLKGTGVLERSIWFKQSDAWTTFWFVPEGVCDQYATCGVNGICTTLYSPPCQCLQGFVPTSDTDWNLRLYSGGCVRRTTLNCSTDEFLKLQNVKLPETLNASLDINKALDECKESCMKNCACIAYTVSGESGCLTWTGDLVDIRTFDDGGDNLYIRLAASELDYLLRTSTKRKTVMIISLTLGLGILFMASLGILLWNRINRKKKRRLDSKQFGTLLNPTRMSQRNQGITNFQDDMLLALGPEMSIENGENDRGAGFSLFQFSDIANATMNFSVENKLGQGGFGPVYKGQLPDGQEIAVKRLSARSGQGLLEFKNEIILIAKLQHRNLVRLLGCSIQGEEKILVYEYLPNKSLDHHLFDSTKGKLLDWQKRYHIIEGIAQGLLYLHKHSRLRIIHRDLKASNILLDSDMNPKISDFGMARIFCTNEAQGNTSRVVGTYGYISPEYAAEGLFSIKSDVFSFGVLFLEIISGKRNAGFHQYGKFLNLLGYAWQLWHDSEWKEIVDQSLGDGYAVNEVSRCIVVALLCVQENASDRPTMTEVISMLTNESAVIPDPKQPAFFTVRLGTDSEEHSTQTKDCSVYDETMTAIQGR